ncbi:hypothetical protein MNL06_02920 [Bartonella krasnovii]|uniref:hypothetical protein n=1 Tax=Bartonella krasnovii TaxID=2267275 RepID=UPI001F4CA529|nr:hypothetical protein [Bartonella krasnovii]UNF46058.1 hypothetical protein MNL06_02920 [Bartonella krasnovii]
MAFPLLFPLLASGGLLLRASPHIFRYLAPKAVTGANRLGQLITKSPVGKFATKNPKFTASMVGGSAIESMMTPEEAHAPSNPYLQNMQNPHGPFMPYTAPRAEMPLGVGNHPPIPEALEDNLQELKPKVDVPQAQPLVSTSQTPPSEPTDLDKFLQSNTYKFFQSDAYQKLKDLFAGMSAAPSGGSGWDALASGVKRLNEGDKQRGKVNQTVEYLKSKGYSEEEARVMASNPQMLSALLTGDDKPKLSPDYQRIFNPQTGEYEAKVIKGSKAYQEAERAKKLHEKNIVRDTVLFNDIGYLDEYMKKHGTYSTGLIAWLKSWMPGTEARGADRVVQALRSHIASNRIDELKSLSRTGGLGLGNVSDKDLDMLKDSLGALSIDMNVELFARSLSQIKDVLEKLSPEAKTFLLGKNNEIQTISQGGGVNFPKMSALEAAKRNDITEFIDIETGQHLRKVKL